MPIATLYDEFPGHAGDLAWLEGLEKEFRRGFELEKVKYKARQLEHRKRELGENKTVDGLGQLKGTIDARTYFRWQQQDEHFWEEEKNTNKFLRDNPECKAPAPERKIQIVV